MNDIQAYCERLLKDLIRIGSFREEQFPAIQEFVLAELRSLGCDAYVEERSGCIIGRKNVGNSARTILLSAHYDTIGPTTAWTMDPLNPRKTEGRIYGLGARGAGSGSNGTKLSGFQGNESAWIDYCRRVLPASFSYTWLCFSYVQTRLEALVYV